MPHLSSSHLVSIVAKLTNPLHRRRERSSQPSSFRPQPRHLRAAAIRRHIGRALTPHTADPRDPTTLSLAPPFPPPRLRNLLHDVRKILRVQISSHFQIPSHHIRARDHSHLAPHIMPVKRRSIIHRHPQQRSQCRLRRPLRQHHPLPLRPRRRPLRRHIHHRQHSPKRPPGSDAPPPPASPPPYSPMQSSSCPLAVILSEAVCRNSDSSHSRRISDLLTSNPLVDP